jgi:hypothetical protein
MGKLTSTHGTRSSAGSATAREPVAVPPKGDTPFTLWQGARPRKRTWHAPHFRLRIPSRRRPPTEGASACDTPSGASSRRSATTIRRSRGGRWSSSSSALLSPSRRSSRCRSWSRGSSQDRRTRKAAPRSLRVTLRGAGTRKVVQSKRERSTNEQSGHRARGPDSRPAHTWSPLLPFLAPSERPRCTSASCGKPSSSLFMRFGRRMQ